MTPNEITTDGYLKLKEAGQTSTLRFQASPDFRGMLKSVSWNLPDDVVHTITTDDEEFQNFKQVGERPEIEVSTDWLSSLELKYPATLRIKFEFTTFRMEPTWYAHLYIMTGYSDQAADADSAYLVKSKVKN